MTRIRAARVARAAAGLALLAIGLGAAPAAAERDCTVPLVDWQPREALQKKLEADGWSAISIRIDDGCYKVKATNAQGERLKMKFDPASLAPVRGDRPDGHDEDD